MYVLHVYALLSFFALLHSFYSLLFEFREFYYANVMTLFTIFIAVMINCQPWLFKIFIKMYSFKNLQLQ